jgi:hypothetical protein
MSSVKGALSLDSFVARFLLMCVSNSATPQASAFIEEWSNFREADDSMQGKLGLKEEARDIMEDEWGEKSEEEHEHGAVGQVVDKFSCEF